MRRLTFSSAKFRGVGSEIVVSIEPAVGALLHWSCSAALGILAHGMAGCGPARARELYGIPQSHEALAVIGLGCPGDEQGAPEEPRRRNQRKPRRTLEQFVFAGRWGQPLPVL